MAELIDSKSIVKKFGKNDKDTGSTAVQVALLTNRINHLAPHFEKHMKDHSGKRGLLKLIGQRKTLLKYLASQDADQYARVIKDLGLRK